MALRVEEFVDTPRLTDADPAHEQFEQVLNTPGWTLIEWQAMQYNHDDNDQRTLIIAVFDVQES